MPVQPEARRGREVAGASPVEFGVQTRNHRRGGLDCRRLRLYLAVRPDAEIGVLDAELGADLRDDLARRAMDEIVVVVAVGDDVLEKTAQMRGAEIGLLDDGRVADRPADQLPLLLGALFPNIPPTPRRRVRLARTSGQKRSWGRTFCRVKSR